MLEVYARYNKAEGNDLDSYRRSWQIAMFYQENRLSDCGRDFSTTRKTVDNIKRRRQGRNHLTINQIF